MIYSVYRAVLYSDSVTPFHGTQINVTSRPPIRTVRPSLRRLSRKSPVHYSTKRTALIPQYPMYGVKLTPSRSVWLSRSRFAQQFLCDNTCTELYGNATNGLVADTTLQTDGLTGRHIRLPRTCLWVQACHAIRLQCSGKQ
jgi:hypothetical protein